MRNSESAHGEASLLVLKREGESGTSGNRQKALTLAGGEVQQGHGRTRPRKPGETCQHQHEARARPIRLRQGEGSRAV